VSGQISSPSLSSQVTLLLYHKLGRTVPPDRRVIHVFASSSKVCLNVILRVAAVALFNQNYVTCFSSCWVIGRLMVLETFKFMNLTATRMPTTCDRSIWWVLQITGSNTVIFCCFRDRTFAAFTLGLNFEVF